MTGSHSTFGVRMFIAILLPGPKVCCNDYKEQHAAADSKKHYSGD